MTKNDKWIELVAKVRELFRERLGEFRTEDFVKVSDLMGFHVLKNVNQILH